MNHIAINAKPEFIKRFSTTSSINAVAELIWNSLDAGGSVISANFITNPIKGLESIEIKDDGFGIDAKKVKELFGNLGDSWKKTTERFNGRTLHGQKGEGRFKAFALGSSVSWESVYLDEADKKKYKFTITGSIAGTNIFTYTDWVETNDPVGTKVTITSIPKAHDRLLNDQTINEFTKIFAGYLRKFPNIEIRIDGTRIVPDDYCKIVETKILHSFTSRDGNCYTATADLVEWKIDVDREILLCDASGIELKSVDAKLRTKGFQFTVLIKSDYFRKLDQQNLLILDDLQPEVQNWVDEGKEIARAYFRKKQAEEVSGIVQHWKDEQIYPFEDKAAKEISPIELAERQVFDIIGVNVQDFLPNFEKADTASKRFTFRLLAQALKTNPESLQTILTEVLNLKPEAQKDLADLLKKNDLTSIIKCAKTVADRLNFLVGLENLLFDKETKEVFLERDQLHKILEHEAWIFDENFTLAASEAKLEEVLALHSAALGKRCDDDSPVLRENGQQGRVDLLLGLSICPRQDERDHLIVELKRPSKKIDADVLNQVQSYALAIAKDPRFDKCKTHWKIIVVSNEMDTLAKAQTSQPNRPRGLALDNAEYNIEVWAFTWTQLLSTARAKLQFLNEKLCYEANRDSAKKYLLEKYEKFIPSVAKSESDKESDTASGGINDQEDFA